MDTSRELFVEDATGWRRGLYDDVRATFRAPVVNWIFRTSVANEPDATRYLWGQVKPLFDTLGLAEYVAEYRDAVVSTVAAGPGVPSLDADALGLDADEHAALLAQLATFDAVVPRLAVLFATVDGALSGTLPAPGEPSYAATAPFPASMARDDLGAPSMVGPDDVPAAGAGTVAAVRAFHGFDDGLPSVYRCLLQWPGAFSTLWAEVEPALEHEAFDDATAAGERRVDAFLAGRAYDPRIAPDDLRAVGVDDDTIDALRTLFADFRRGPVRTVLPAVVVLAAVVGAGGPRRSG